MKSLSRLAAIATFALLLAPDVQANDKSPGKLGVGASLGGKRAFPDDNAWNKDSAEKPSC